MDKEQCATCKHYHCEINEVYVGEKGRNDLVDDVMSGVAEKQYCSKCRCWQSAIKPGHPDDRENMWCVQYDGEQQDVGCPLWEQKDGEQP